MTSIRRQIHYTPKAPIMQGIYSGGGSHYVYLGSNRFGRSIRTVSYWRVQAQAKQALINMGEILKTAGCAYENVVKTTVFLTDINDFNCVNDIYKQFYSRNIPARSAFQVAAVPRGGLVEIEAVAVLGPITDAP